MSMVQHNIFSSFSRFSGEFDSRFSYDFLGVRTRKFFAPYLLQSEVQEGIVEFPGPSEDYFEWIDMLEAVTSATKQFVMIELGAGWGKWIVRAVAALRQVNPQLPHTVIGVEADPINFSLMELHVQDNNVNPDEYYLIQSSVSDANGAVWFAGGELEGISSGSFMIKDLNLKTWVVLAIGLLPEKIVKGLRKITGKRLFKIKPQKVNMISLKTLLSPYDHVDLIDMDIQGAELLVVKAATGILDQKVKRVHIETHSREDEIGLRVIFEGLGWSNVFDYPLNKESNTSSVNFFL